MALAKKGTRSIMVNDARFRWTVSPDDEPGIGVVVEDYSVPGQRAAIWVEHGNILSPGLVRHFILHALAHGWNPKKRGPQLVFRLSNHPKKSPPQAVNLHDLQIRKVTSPALT